jgi:type II secretory pathway component GspD/PulD (secretin)
MKTTIAAGLSLLIAACASTRPAPLPALGSIRELPVNYHAQLEARTSDAPSAGPARAEAVQVPPAETVLEVHCQIARIDRDSLRELVPDSSTGIFARVVARGAFDSARESLAGRSEFVLLSCPTLSVRDGQAASVLVGDQRAYARGFSIQNVGLGLIADPEIDVAQAGYSLKAMSKLSADRAHVDLDITWACATMQTPFAEIVTQLPGTDTRVTLQVPILFEQTLATSGSLAPDEVLLLGGLVDENGRDCIACLTADRAAPEAARGAALRTSSPLAAEFAVR